MYHVDLPFFDECGWQFQWPRGNTNPLFSVRFMAETLMKLQNGITLEQNWKIPSVRNSSNSSSSSNNPKSVFFDGTAIFTYVWRDVWPLEYYLHDAANGLSCRPQVNFVVMKGTRKICIHVDKLFMKATDGQLIVGFKRILISYPRLAPCSHDSGVTEEIDEQRINWGSCSKLQKKSRSAAQVLTLESVGQFV